MFSLHERINPLRIIRAWLSAGRIFIGGYWCIEIAVLGIGSCRCVLRLGLAAAMRTRRLFDPCRWLTGLDHLDVLEGFRMGIPVRLFAASLQW